MIVFPCNQEVDMDSGMKGVEVFYSFEAKVKCAGTKLLRMCCIGSIWSVSYVNSGLVQGSWPKWDIECKAAFYPASNILNVDDLRRILR